MPMALLGMLASLAVWEGVRYCRDHWALTTTAPGIAQALLHCAQIGEFLPNTWFDIFSFQVKIVIATLARSHR